MSLWPATALLAALALVSPGCQFAAHTQNMEGVRMYGQTYYQGALQEFLAAAQSDPNNADAYYNVAATYQQLGRLQQSKQQLQQAENYYRLALEHSGTSNQPEYYRGLAVLLVEEGRSPEAFKLLDDWSARNPALAAPKIELAQLAFESGDREAATNHLVEAAKVDPLNARVLADLGKVREDSGDVAQAVANYQRSLALDQNQPEVAQRIARLQTGVAVGPIVTPPGGTRMVTTPGATLR